MKKYKSLIILSIFLSIFMVSCDKGDSEEVPTNNPSGNYFYNSSSSYYDANGDIEYDAKSTGSIYVELNGNSDPTLLITPSIGYQFSIRASNLQIHGDTTTFSIMQQQISLQGNTYNVEGVNGVDVGDLGKYDGYFTDKTIVFDYRSINIETFEYVRTRTDASKRN